MTLSSRDIIVFDEPFKDLSHMTSKLGKVYGRVARRSRLIVLDLSKSFLKLPFISRV